MGDWQQAGSPRRGLREGEVRIPSGCAIAAIMDRTGARHDGSDICRSIALMHDRSNGLGGGFAAYGIYPEYAELYAFHILYESHEARMATELYLNDHFLCEKQERIPTTPVRSIKNPPDSWRYFLTPHPSRHDLEFGEFDEAEYTMQCVFHINARIEGAFVASSGKNMGAFKGVGYPEEIGEYYRIDDYKAWLWTAHGRFPTNTPGWWGGPHPFTLLNWSIVHNRHRGHHVSVRPAGASPRLLAGDGGAHHGRALVGRDRPHAARARRVRDGAALYLFRLPGQRAVLRHPGLRRRAAEAARPHGGREGLHGVSG